jgi:hypothetical protein
MESTIRIVLWRNFSGATDMLHSILMICPDSYWAAHRKFYYLTYHTVVFLDYYVSFPVKEFQPVLPYHLTDQADWPADAIDDVLPAQAYTRENIANAIRLIQGNAQRLICLTPSELLDSRWIQPEEIPLHGLCPTVVENYSIWEILFYNLRHLQHHIGQLNLLLRQEMNLSAEWITYGDR